MIRPSCMTSAVSRELLELVYQFGCPKKEPQKLSSTLPKSFFFYQTDNKFFFCVNFIETHLIGLTFESNIVWQKKNKHGNFMKKHPMAMPSFPDAPSF